MVAFRHRAVESWSHGKVGLEGTQRITEPWHGCVGRDLHNHGPLVVIFPELLGAAWSLELLSKCLVDTRFRRAKWEAVPCAAFLVTAVTTAATWGHLCSTLPFLPSLLAL